MKIQSNLNGNIKWYLGNTVIFKVDRTLSREFLEPYALCLDLTTGKTSTQPPIAMYSLKGKDFILNEVLGVTFTCAA